MAAERAGRQAHADSPRLLRPDRPAADAGGGGGVPRRCLARTPSRRSWTACSRRRTTANAGAATGSTWRATPTPRDSPTGGARRRRSIPYAWTYRDYVIKAFNDDLPYDQFIREQLAADLLATARAREESGDAGGARLPDTGRSLQRQPARRHQRSHRRDVEGVSRPHGHLRALPRSQVRSDSDGGLLLALRHLRELGGTREEPVIAPPNAAHAEYLVKRQEMDDRIQTQVEQNIASSSATTGVMAAST